MFKRILSIVIGLIIFICTGAISEGKPLKIMTSIIPQKYIVEQIGGGDVQVEAFVRPGESPAIYQPTPQQMIRAGESSLYFTIGVPFENRFVPRIRQSFSGLSVIDQAKNVNRRRIGSDNHGPDAEHEHDNDLDPHIWLSPQCLVAMAENTCSALVSVNPADSGKYRANLDDFKARIEKADSSIAKVLEPYAGRTVYVYHPAFAYFLEEYGLHQKAVETGGKSPTPSQIIDLIKKAKRDNVGVIFVQPQFDPTSAKKIAEGIGGKVVVMDPLEYDIIENLHKMADQIASALK